MNKIKIVISGENKENWKDWGNGKFSHVEFSDSRFFKLPQSTSDWQKYKNYDYILAHPGGDSKTDYIDRLSKYLNEIPKSPDTLQLLEHPKVIFISIGSEQWKTPRLVRNYLKFLHDNNKEPKPDILYGLYLIEMIELSNKDSTITLSLEENRDELKLGDRTISASYKAEIFDKNGNPVTTITINDEDLGKIKETLIEIKFFNYNKKEFIETFLPFIIDLEGISECLKRGSQPSNCEDYLDEIVKQYQNDKPIDKFIKEFKDKIDDHILKLLEAKTDTTYENIPHILFSILKLFKSKDIDNRGKFKEGIIENISKIKKWYKNTLRKLPE